MNAPAQFPPIETPDLDVAIIGSGFAGIAMAVALRKAGRTNFKIFEKASELGGTWRDNTYPGCACDVPSHMYSFSFDLNPGWTRAYSRQSEIWDYMARTSTKFGVDQHIQTDSEFVAANFDETQGLWRIRFKNGKTVSAKHLVSGIGGLHIPSIPKYKGAENFKGAVFHSAQWRHDIDLTGKRVAVVGTGASAMQFAPEIADKVGHMAVYQRTAPWIVPRMDYAYPDWAKRAFAAIPGFMRAYRWSIYWRAELLLGTAFTQRPSMIDRIEKFGTDHRLAQVKDHILAEKVRPQYRLGCKRILISNDWYPMLQKPNVELVTDGIDEITATGIRTKDGQERAFDVIIYGTGFAAFDGFAGLEIRGRQGKDLREVWKDVAKSYYGITTNGFPNFFMLLGPNTGLGHNSIIFMIEAQVAHIMGCIKLLDEDGRASIEVRHEVQERFHSKLQEQLKQTVWKSGCKSWYENADGVNNTTWPSYTFKYWLQVHAPKAEDFAFTPVLQAA